MSLGTAILALIMALVLAGCDDLMIRAEYGESPIAEKAEAGFYNIGDSLFTDPEIARVCVVVGNDDLNEYVKYKRELIHSENYNFVVINTLNGDELVERLHWSWLKPAEGYTICTDDPSKIKVIKIQEQRLHVQLVR